MVIKVRDKKQKLFKQATTLIIFLATLAIFISANKNVYGFYTFRNSTFFLSDHSLYKINQKDFSSLNEGDNIYYYEKSNNKYIIKSDKLLFKGTTNSKPIYVLSSKPDEVISGERIVGKLALKSSILGIVSTILTSRVFCFLFLIIPLMALMTYRFYNAITLPGEIMPIKLNNDFVALPKFKSKSKIPTRAQRLSIQRG